MCQGWRVPNHAPGDNPHVHVAHQGGHVTRRGIEPIKPDPPTRRKLAALGVAVSVDGYGKDQASEKAGGPAHTASAHSGNTRVE